MVIFGSARSDENGKISGGAAGDQSGREVSKQNWYLHSKGWYVLRPINPDVAEKIARNMENACYNSNIGYDQSQNTSLYKVAKNCGFDCAKVNTPCETDCARLVRVCILYAGINVSDFYTGSLKDEVLKTGAFILFADDKHCKSPDHLKRGDILVTRTKGHVVVALTDGDLVKDDAPVFVNIEMPILKRGAKGLEVVTLQRLLEDHNISVGKWGCDGEMGNDTEAAVKKYQTKYSLLIDGEVGIETWTHLLKGR